MAELIYKLNTEEEVRILSKMANTRGNNMPVPLKRTYHLCCTTCADEGVATPICNHPVDSLDRCACQHIILIEKDPFHIVGDRDIIYASHLHNAVAEGPHELVNYSSFHFYIEHQICKVCHAKLGVRYVRSVHNDVEFLMDLHHGYMMTEPVAEHHPQPIFFLDRSKVCICRLRIVGVGAGGGGGGEM